MTQKEPKNPSKKTITREEWPFCCHDTDESKCHKVVWK
jgi:hypothetical protein